jgi:hypothetical protein
MSKFQCDEYHSIYLDLTRNIRTIRKQISHNPANPYQVQDLLQIIKDVRGRVAETDWAQLRSNVSESEVGVGFWNITRQLGIRYFPRSIRLGRRQTQIRLSTRD